MKIIAAIGTRELNDLPAGVQLAYVNAVALAVDRGYIIRTGAAPGADQVAASCAVNRGGQVQLVLPWRAYESAWVNFVRAEYNHAVAIEIYTASQHPDWTESVGQYHPAVARLTRGAFALHARNYGIVYPASGVIAIPRHTSKGAGGTGQGMRIAMALNIPCFDMNLAAEQCLHWLQTP